MGRLKKILKALKLVFFENIFTRKVCINNNKAIFSFTFDDVPISAAIVGAGILEQVNATGTYYVALGMEAVNEENGDKRRFINKNEIQLLHSNGHDIGCHTFSHLNLRKTNTEKVISDCERNTRSLEKIINTESIDHFAYPFGMVSPGGKRILGSKYKTLRTTDYGINFGNTDLTHLRAVNLYSNSFDKKSIQKVINKAVKNQAWLIFYSHDICDNPSPWGTTPADLKWVVEQCVKVDGEILNVNQAFSKIISN